MVAGGSTRVSIPADGRVRVGLHLSLTPPCSSSRSIAADLGISPLEIILGWFAYNIDLVMWFMETIPFCLLKMPIQFLFLKEIILVCSSHPIQRFLGVTTTEVKWRIHSPELTDFLAFGIRITLNSRQTKQSYSSPCTLKCHQLTLPNS